MNQFQDLIISNEPGIISKERARFQTVSEFARQNLFFAVWSDEYTLDTHYSVSRDFLDYYSVTEIIEGEMEFIYDDEAFTARAGNLVLLDFHKPHFYRAASSKVIKWEMLFKGNITSEYYNLITGEHGFVHKNKGRIKSLVDRLKQELTSLYPEEHKISSLICDLLSNIYLQEKEDFSSIIQAAISYINQNFSDRLLVKDVANHLGLSKYYFSRLFTRDTGFSPHNYIRHVRIREAKELLTTLDIPVSEIAEKCGFINTSHFIRVFHENVGQTPLEFKNSFIIK